MVTCDLELKFDILYFVFMMPNRFFSY